MNLMMPLRIAFRALRSNKMRSFLTMLGIIIGIAAVIALVSIGSGASRKVADQIASIGSNLIMVMPGSTTSGGLRAGPGAAPTLTYEDALAIGRECRSVALVAPETRGVAQVVYGNQNWSTSVQGVTPDFLAVRNWNVTAGRNITASDQEGAAKTCLVGQTIASGLFGDEDPIGKTIRVKKIPFTVVGLLDVKGQSTMGTDQDDVVLVPLRTAQSKLFASQFTGTVGVIVVKAVSEEALGEAEQEVTELLNQRHRVGPAHDADFTVRNLSEFLSVAQQSSMVMTFLLAAVASISLVVGGIGIMNIMLVSVTERTREIGIRMAIGAKERDILLQFLTEAVLLTTGGGIIGMVLGVTGAAIVARIVGWPVVVSTQSIVIAFVFSAAVGIFFGFYPARKAAALDPIEALRYE